MTLAISSKTINRIKHCCAKQVLPLALSLCTALVLQTISAVASQLPEPSFKEIASLCAPETEYSTLRAVALVESHFDPLAIRDNRTREAWAPSNLAAAAALARERLEKGHSLDLGIMQINSKNLASLGMSVFDAFDPCRSVSAAQKILQFAMATGSSETERQAALLITLSRYNTGQPLAGIANGYVDEVIKAQHIAPAKAVQQSPALNPPTQWDIWGATGTRTPGWFVAVNESIDFLRAGAQSTAARLPGRAAGQPSMTGVPYELSAFKESQTSQR